MSVHCIHCQAQLTEREAREREARERWCNECGTPLPELVTATPTVLPAPAEAEPPRPYDWSERDLTTGVLEAQVLARKRASSILFFVALLQFVCGGAFVVMWAVPEPNAPKLSEVGLAAVMIEWLVISLLFTGLGWWARYQPLPATQLGLVIYLALALLSYCVSPEAAGFGILVKLAVVVAMVRAILMAAKADDRKIRTEKESP